MKFEFNSELIIGTILIVWGLSIFIKLIWGIDIPIFKPLLGIFLIYLGLSFIFNEPLCFTNRRTFSAQWHTNDESENK
jgi:hypothetical protein